jgi:transcriptional regulator with XRE-family HTH domain
MQISEHMAPEAALTELGRRVARRRIELGVTQADVAKRAGLGKRTVERIEAGGDCQVSTLLRLLRVLDLMDGVEGLVPEVGVRPMDLLELRGKERQRAPRKPAPPAKGGWRWGDES